MTNSTREALIIVVVGSVLIGGGAVLRFRAPSTDAVPSVDLTPAVAIEAALLDYNPQDAMRLPDDYDPAADYCWDRYLTLSSYYWDAEQRADSLEHEVYRLRGRVADLEQGVERPTVGGVQ